MHNKIRTLKDIIDWRLCVGCGACASVCKSNCIELIDYSIQGIRPFIHSDKCIGCNDCLQVCPGHAVDLLSSAPGFKSFHNIDEKGWGPIYGIWEGYAVDPDIRFKGSSGGVATALSLYCMEEMGMHGTLHVGGNQSNPIANEIFLDRNRSDLLKRTGSRYAPASPCAGFREIESAPAPCIFIGKPCDVAGLYKACRRNGELLKNNGLSISIFCAGTPSTYGNIELLRELKIDMQKIKEVRYRGDGWPGFFNVSMLDGEASKQITYSQAWGFLQKFRPYRCYLCPDGTGAYSDISCGDPWHRENESSDSGYSLILTRTKRGEDVLSCAASAGYVALQRTDIQSLIASQFGLLYKRKEIWGRLITMRAFGLPTPQYPGFELATQWLHLPTIDKIKTILGTARRIIQRHYRAPASLPHALL